MIAKGKAPCKNDTSRMNLNINPKATVYAGGDQTSASLRPVEISGSEATNYTSLQWTTSGSGTFSDPASLHTVYIPGEPDVNAGHAVLTLIANPAPPCDPVSDTMNLILVHAPVASPGPDGNICQGMSYTVSGVTIVNSSGFTWENDGRGELKDAGTLTPTYVPAPDELGTVRLTLKADGISACHDSSASCNMKIVIFPVPVVNAGKDQWVQYDSSTILTCETSGVRAVSSTCGAPGHSLIDNSVKGSSKVNLALRS